MVESAAVSYRLFLRPDDYGVIHLLVLLTVPQGLLSNRLEYKGTCGTFCIRRFIWLMCLPAKCKVLLQECAEQVCDHIFGRIAGFALFKELTYCHQIIAGGDDGLFHITILADLRKAGSGRQVVAQAGAVDGVFNSAALFNENIHWFGCAAIADRAIFPFIKDAKKAEVANSITALYASARKVPPIWQLKKPVGGSRTCNTLSSSFAGTYVSGHLSWIRRREGKCGAYLHTCRAASMPLVLGLP